ncbi:hypothetical protein MLD38_006691 [Melastoma candidum]|nr:hypothetical protein MLD38_006691 [Melastoma candidum]
MLIILNLKHCKELRRLPEGIADLGNLKQFLLDESGVLKFPDWGTSRPSGSIQSLTKLDCRGAQIVELCRFIGVLKSLEVLRLTHCKSLTRLPDEIGELTSLTVLNVSHSSVEELPKSIGCLTNLKILQASFTSIKKLPATIRKLTNLEELHCFSTPLEGKLPPGLKKLKSLKTLRCTETSISSVPRLPSNLTTLEISSKCLQVIPDLRELSDLKLLDLNIDTSEPELSDTTGPSWMGMLQKLETLTFSMPHVVALFPDIGGLPLLKIVVLSNCKNLRDIPRLPSCIKTLDIQGCPSLISMPDLENMKSMTTLKIEGCSVEEVRGSEQLESLTDLRITMCHSLRRIPDLSGLTKLKELTLSSCSKLVRLQGRTDSLRTLLVMNCPSLTRLPDLRQFPALKNLVVYKCPKIRDIKEFAELKTSVNVHFPPRKGNENEFEGNIVR